MSNSKIDLFDLIKRILHQWKFILVVMLVCGLVFECFGYARAYMDYRREADSANQEDKPSDQYVQVLENEEAGLTEREISEVQVAADAYPLYMRQYQEDLLYCQNAVKMQLDANSVPTYTMHYAITGADVDNQVIDHIASTMEEWVVNEETCEEIRETLGWDVALSYIEDLIEIKTEEDTDESVTIVVDSDTGDHVTVQIQSPTKDECQSMAEIVKNHISQETTNLQDRYGSFELDLLTETYAEKVDYDLRSFQEGRYTALNNLRGSISGLPSSMTDDQKDYYYDLIAYHAALESEKEALAGEEDAEEEIAEEDAAAIAKPGIIRWRFIILGLLLGLILACGYILLRYLLASHLRVKEDMEDTYHVPMLGYFPVSEKRQRFTKEERIEMICAGIRVAAQKDDMKSIYLTGTAGDGESEQIIEQIQASLADSDVQISSGRDVACDPASLEQMTASDGVVFVERVDRSPYADIQKEVELCQTYNIPVIGSVVIE